MMTSKTLVAEQGSQPTFADVRVGIMRIGSRDGRVVAQLAVRSPRNQDIVVVDVGDSIQLHGAGELRIDAITVAEGSARGTVSFTFRPSGAQ